MTNKTAAESPADQMKRLDHAIEAKFAKIISDCLETIVKSESKNAPNAK
jgi:hypothetical protein